MESFAKVGAYMDCLHIKDLYQSYGQHTVLADFNLVAKQGAVTCILGRSGVGKTTLFHLIAGLLTPDQGTIVLQGVDITGQPGHVAYMHQKDLLLPFKTVMDNVLLPLLLDGWDKRKAIVYVTDLLPQFGLTGTANYYPAQLSGGMRQRVALLRTYLMNKPLCLLDEPFSALDDITKNSLYDWYRAMSTNLSLTTLLITHSIDEALQLADYVYVLKGPTHLVGPLHIERSSNFGLSPQYLSYKQSILTQLH